MALPIPRPLLSVTPLTDYGPPIKLFYIKPDHPAASPASLGPPLSPCSPSPPLILPTIFTAPQGQLSLESCGLGTVPRGWEVPALPSANPQGRWKREDSMAERGYLEGETKETISGYHLVPWALVPRAEVTPMPGVRGRGRGRCLRKGGVRASPVCVLGRDFKPGRWKACLPSRFLLDPEEKMWCVGMG